ncbi:MAG: dienelactone hydrolase family protein [Humidesulfovibrio sp.]|nr:dienelactone hydrolase family protein [Humidesulfovibrio sp.]
MKEAHQSRRSPRKWAVCLLASMTLNLGFLPVRVDARLLEEVINVPVTVTNFYGKEVSQDIVVTVFVEDATPSPRPLLVIGHGRKSGEADRVKMGRRRYSATSSWFAQLGFLVAVPTRIGYGVSGGEDVEYSGSCSSRQYPPACRAAAAQTLRVLDTLRQRRDAVKDRAVIVGQSFGGAAAITAAALNPPGVQAVINFAGGGGGNPEDRPQSPCSPELLERMFATCGKSSRVPTLWMYAENDRYWGPAYPREWFEAFVKSGGVGEFVMYPPHGKDGHSLFVAGPEVWRPRVLEFLRANGYPELREPPAAAPRPKQAALLAPETAQ